MKLPTDLELMQLILFETLEQARINLNKHFPGWTIKEVRPQVFKVYRPNGTVYKTLGADR